MSQPMPDTTAAPAERETAPPRDFDVQFVSDIGTGGFLAYYVRGHVDAEAFRQQCIYDFGLDVEPGIEWVRHEWWRSVPTQSDYATTMLIPAKPGSRGAYAVTVLDMDGFRIATRRLARQALAEAPR